MARKLEIIQQEMLTAKENQYALAGLQDTTSVTNIFQKFWDYLFGTQRSTSKVAVWRLWVYIVSFCIYSLEVIFDLHRKDIDDKLSKLIPGTPNWYRQKMLGFQYGFNLIPGTDKFDNTGKSDDEIELSKIIKYCAVNELEDESRLIVKIATEVNGVLTPVSTTQYEAIKTYINKEFKYAGVKVTLINYLPDRLKLNLRIIRDALVLDSNGMNRQTGEYPVNDAIQAFMKELPFNGKLSLQRLEEKLLAVLGVKDLSLDLAQTAWIDADTNSYGSWQPIDISKIPISGYFTVNLTEANETKSTISYV